MVYKNKDRLDDELDFIKEYFNFEDNPNFDIHRIKKSFLDKVDNYKKKENLEDYQIDFDNFNLLDNQIQKNANNDIDTSTPNKNNEFCLLLLHNNKNKYYFILLL